MTEKQEQRIKRRERAARKKEWQKILEKYAEFAAYVVNRKKEDSNSIGLLKREAFC